MTTQPLIDYANATVKLPQMMRKLDDQLNDQKWDDARQTLEAIEQLQADLKAWLHAKIKSAK